MYLIAREDGVSIVRGCGEVRQSCNINLGGYESEKLRTREGFWQLQGIKRRECY